MNLLIIMLSLCGTQSERDTVIDQLQQLYARHASFQADFEQEVVQSATGRMFKSKGRVYFKKPGKMRWDYLSPARELYISDGTYLWHYVPDDARATRLQIHNSRLFHSLKFLFGLGNLSKEFEARLLPRESGAPYRLELLPKSGHEVYKRLVLTISPTSFRIQHSELTDPHDNVTRIRFQQQQLDPTKPIPDQAFRFEPPSGVKVRDLSSSDSAQTQPQTP